MTVSRYRMRFEKREALRFISHHDLMRVFELALRRSGLRVAHTQGFNPHPKVSFALAIPLGVESLDEIVDIDIEHEAEAPAPEQVVNQLGAVMPRVSGCCGPRSRRAARGLSRSSTSASFRRTLQN
ncbi:MAG: TIGR03936 family radical SAM-associated protein [Planctomycetota bacterium]|nr:TIGR03936 family radical SAM-associated protein [Planctomycetota bacterium]